MRIFLQSPPSGRHACIFFRLAGQLSQLCAQAIHSLHIFSHNYPPERTSYDSVSCLTMCGALLSPLGDAFVPFRKLYRKPRSHALGRVAAARSCQPNSNLYSYIMQR